MAELAADEPSVAPEGADVLPAATVDPLVAHHQAELQALRQELEEALRQADEAEHRLRANPTAAVFDDAFEATVMASVARLVAGATDLDAAPATPPVTGRDEAVSHEPVRPSEPAPARPRTTVVNRGTPRTVVVDRSGSTSAPPAGPPAVSDTLDAGTKPAKDRATRIRGRLLILAGIVVILVALVLLKIS
jgi:hypothetical protein